MASRLDQSNSRREREVVYVLGFVFVFVLFCVVSCDCFCGSGRAGSLDLGTDRKSLVEVERGSMEGAWMHTIPYGYLWDSLQAATQERRCPLA
mmetsp:Transcript_9108/g.17168  ORF Transcript_9108/g.17168 Transcript_9108/m.17168 type:complete len:93 (-) Transcript_9108:1653-1931(-)